MRQRLFISGGSGFVGSAVIRAALAAGYDVTALVGRRPLTVTDDRLRPVAGDLFDPDLKTTVSRCDAVVHLVGIIRESRGNGFDRIHRQGTRAMVDAATAAGVRRFVHMSALGARPDAPARYHQTKYAAEQIVRGAHLDWTIFQPSLIHGPAGEFTRMQIGWATGKAVPYLFMPYFGTGFFGRGKPRVQPIWVDDVARAFVQSIGQADTVGQVFPIAGATRLTWPQMHHLAATTLTRRDKPAVPIPAWYAKLLTRLVPPALLPFTADQVTMSESDNVADLSKFTRYFGWEPTGYASALKSYAPAAKLV